MKVLSRTPYTEVSNAWGRPVRQRELRMEIEPADVGKTRQHFMGFNHGWTTFTAADVGKTIIVYEDGKGWTNWIFAPVTTPKENP